MMNSSRSSFTSSFSVVDRAEAGRTALVNVTFGALGYWGVTEASRSRSKKAGFFELHSVIASVYASQNSSYRLADPPGTAQVASRASVSDHRAIPLNRATPRTPALG